MKLFFALVAILCAHSYADVTYTFRFTPDEMARLKLMPHQGQLNMTAEDAEGEYKSSIPGCLPLIAVVKGTQGFNSEQIVINGVALNQTSGNVFVHESGGLQYRGFNLDGKSPSEMVNTGPRKEIHVIFATPDTFALHSNEMDRSCIYSR